jgi:hypothetical protein
MMRGGIAAKTASRASGAMIKEEVTHAMLMDNVGV